MTFNICFNSFTDFKDTCIIYAKKGLDICQMILKFLYVKTLTLYYRFVSILKGKGIDRVNSKTISEALQIDSATIRRDFSYFGELGKKGYGYNIDSMLEFFKSEL